MLVARGPARAAAVLGALGIASALARTGHEDARGPLAFLQVDSAVEGEATKRSPAESVALKEARRIERETREEAKRERDAKRAERNAQRKAEREARERADAAQQAQREADLQAQQEAEDAAERALLAEFEAKKKTASALQEKSEAGVEPTKGEATETAAAARAAQAGAEGVAAQDEKNEDLEAEDAAEDAAERALLAEFEAKKKASPPLQEASEATAKPTRAGGNTETANAAEKVEPRAEKAESQGKAEDDAEAQEGAEDEAERALLAESAAKKVAAPAPQATNAAQAQAPEGLEAEFAEAERELQEKTRRSKAQAEAEGWRATNAELEAAEADSEIQAAGRAEKAAAARAGAAGASAGAAEDAAGLDWQREAQRLEELDQARERQEAEAEERRMAKAAERMAEIQAKEQQQAAAESAKTAVSLRSLASGALVDAAVMQAGGVAYQEALDEAAERMAAKAAEERLIKAQQDDIDSLMAQEDPADVREDKRTHILKFGYTKQGACPEGEDCFVHTMSNQRGNLHKPLVVQLNRGKLGHHMFQWAAALSLAKELKDREFRLVLREGRYEPASTLQMARLRPVVWNSSDYEMLQKNKQKCHMWDKMPLVIDSNMESFNEEVSWGSAKGEYHTPAVFEPPDDGNLAAAVAKSFLHTETPHKCRFWELDGYFLNQGFFRHHIDLVRAAFWDEGTAAKAEDTLRWLLWNEKAKGAAVGIHIRFGDDDFTGRTLLTSYYSKALAEIKNRSPDAPLTCMIFSDKMGEAMKRSKRFELCDSRIPMPTTMADQKTFYMMSLLPNLVIADSVFSFWAARVSPNDPFVVAPEIQTGVPHRDKEYEYLAQTPGWTTIETNVTSVGPGAQKQVDEQVEVIKDTPSGYLRLGEGHCRNGYYTGHVVEEAIDTFTCAKKCNSEKNCMFFSLQKRKTCSRYNSNAGACDLAVSRGGTDVPKMVRKMVQESRESPSFTLHDYHLSRGVQPRASAPIVRWLL
ncbi:unnamed protein product [Prorocentrum cordatum]|uniref:Protein xylosyltransferase n=1 Tax=Prorocentrum cordatum TaxID=2364126 RepID=A0ABN9QLB8_9DINO|nr:unnamed protein product [Polarella glacialis]